MAKSISCFKIITCGSDSADKDDLEVSEVPDSSRLRSSLFFFTQISLTFSRFSFDLFNPGLMFL